MFNLKNLTKKIKNKKLKGNISLLVILILLATSVITLLSINQIQRLITYWNQTFNYFRAYYLAKAWTELWLAEVYNRGDGFNHSVTGGNSIVTWNLVWDYSGFNPYFNMTISWSFLYLTNDIRESEECLDENRIRLETGAGVMLSLFSDITKWTKKILTWWEPEIKAMNKEEIKKLQLEKDSPSANNSLTFAFFTYKLTNNEEGEDDYTIDDIIVEKGKDPKDLNSFLSSDAKYLVDSTDTNTKKYLTIKNSWEEPVEFCITIKSKDIPIPYSNSLITVVWHYGGTEVGIQSIVKKWVPDWTLNVWGKEE